MPHWASNVEAVINTAVIAVATIDREIEVEAFREGLLVSGSGYSNEYSQNDLDQILETLDPNDPAPVVLGHPRMDSPAYGWISKGKKVLRDGHNRLVFNVGDMTSQFAEWLENKHFRKVSVGLWHPNDKHNPTPGRWKLRHLGFLGGTPPAVSGLQMVQYSEDDTYLTVEYGSAEDKATISNGFRSLSSVMRSFREWVISEKDIEAADRLIPSYLIDDLEWTAGRLMQTAEEDMKGEMGMGYATYSEALSVALDGKDLDQIATAANMPARDIRLFATGIASPSAKQISILSDALGGIELTPDPKLPSENVTPTYAMTDTNKTPDIQNSDNPTPAKDTAASESVNFAAENARLSAENATLQGKVDSLTAQFSALEARFNQQQVNAEKQAAIAFATKLASPDQRKILPAQIPAVADRIMAFDNTQEITFSADVPPKTQRQMYMDTLAAGQPLYSDDQILADDQPLETQFAAVREAQQKGYDKDSISDDLKIQSYMKEHGGYTLADMRSADFEKRQAATLAYSQAMDALNIDYTG